MIDSIKKTYRPTPLLLTVLALSLVGGTILFWFFRHKSNNYIDRATAHYVHELIKVVDIPFEDHIDNAIMNLEMIDEYISHFYHARDCNSNELKDAMNYFSRLSKAEEILFIDSLACYTGISGITGTLKTDTAVLRAIFKDRTPIARHIKWVDDYSKYAIAIPIEPCSIDCREYKALAFIFNPGVLNTFAAVHSYSGAAQLFVMDENGNIVFSNSAFVDAGNHLEDYLRKGIMTQAQVDSITNDFRTGRHSWIKIQKDGLDTFFCYHSGGHNEYSLAMEVPSANARSILTTFQTMLLYSAFAIAGLLIVILLVLTVFIMLNRHNKKIADSEKKISMAKSAFLNNMSHDIRTPMNAIIGYTTLALTKIDEPDVIEDYLTKIRTSSSHLLSLINDILEMSRIEAGKVQLELSSNSIPVMLGDIESIVRADIDVHGHQLTVDCSSVVNDVVICDKLRIRQIILNLLSNAIKYTPDGGRIELSVHESKSDRQGCSHYSFSVKDNGMGMSQEFAKTVFDEFTRERNSTISGIQGTGLGMAIVSNLVTLMDGRIDMHTRQNAGTEFILNFDFAIGSHSDLENSTSVSHYDFSGKKILLVEDNELNREIATTILEESGFTVSSADNGQKAVEMARNAAPGQYDIILMDIQMPVMNGIEATGQIRALDSEISRIPIIAMTANAFEEDRKEAIKAGMNEHIAKPIDIDKLKAALAKFL